MKRDAGRREIGLNTVGGHIAPAIVQMPGGSAMSMLTAITLIAAMVAAAQAQATLTFDVASVKPTASENAGPMKLQRVNLAPGDHVVYTNTTLHLILQSAFVISDIEGGPAWVNNDRFDIEAKSEKPVSQDDHRAMMRALLADRFKLATHTEARSRPVYALVLARSDGKLGRHLRVAESDCATLRGKAGPPGPGVMPCGNVANAMLAGDMTVRGLPLSNLAILGAEAGRPVVNRTGLDGLFDWELKWTPQRFLQGSFDRERFPTVDPNGPGILTAIQEQLGLKLEATKDDRPVLVIDHVDRPTPD